MLYIRQLKQTETTTFDPSPQHPIWRSPLIFASLMIRFSLTGLSAKNVKGAAAAHSFPIFYTHYNSYDHACFQVETLGKRIRASGLAACGISPSIQDGNRWLCSKPNVVMPSVMPSERRKFIVELAEPFYVQLKDPVLMPEQRIAMNGHDEDYMEPPSHPATSKRYTNKLQFHPFNTCWTSFRLEKFCARISHLFDCNNHCTC